MTLQLLKDKMEKRIELINKNFIFKIIPHFRSDFKSISKELHLHFYNCEKDVYQNSLNGIEHSRFEVLKELKDKYKAECIIDSENPDLFSVNSFVQIIYNNNERQIIEFEEDGELNLFLKELHNKDVKFIEVKVNDY